MKEVSNMKKFVDKIKQKWEDNPLEVLVSGAAIVTAATVVLNVVSAAASRHAYVKLVDNKIKNG